MASTRSLHGLDLVIPPEWEDFSSYTFLVPPRDTDRAARPTLAEIRELQANVVITRHALDEGVTFDQVFAASNAGFAERDPGFKVHAAGAARVAGHDARWQDSERLHAATGLTVHQRHLAVATQLPHFCLLALTGSALDLERLSRALGVSLGAA